jgi:hypothetical protein
MTYLIGITAAVLVIAACGVVKVKILDPLAENTQDLQDLVVLVSDMSGKEEE